MVVQPIISFLFSNIDKSIDIRWDGCQAQSTKQNYENNGQRKYPDGFVYVMNTKFKHTYDFFFLEISYGPFYNGNDLQEHIDEDFERLAKFGKNSYVYNYNFMDKFEIKDTLTEVLEKLIVICFHFYRK